MENLYIYSAYIHVRNPHRKTKTVKVEEGLKSSLICSIAWRNNERDGIETIVHSIYRYSGEVNLGLYIANRRDKINIKQQITKPLVCRRWFEKVAQTSYVFETVGCFEFPKYAIIVGLQDYSFVLQNIGDLFHNTGLLKYKEINGKRKSVLMSAQKCNLHLYLTLKIM